MSSKKNNLPALAPSELEIMDVVWDQGETSINEVLERVNELRESPLRRTTIQVQMQRLEQKGWLDHREDGRTFLYSACREREETRASIANDMKERVFGGSAVDLVRCLVDQKKISTAELNRLKKMISEMK